MANFRNAEGQRGKGLLTKSVQAGVAHDQTEGRSFFWPDAVQHDGAQQTEAI